LICWRLLFPAAIATAGLGLLAFVVSFCNRYRGFGFAGVACFLLQSLLRVICAILILMTNRNPRPMGVVIA
jgi:hypothetical protein